MVGEGPKSGFSDRGWKENLPKYELNTHRSAPFFSGQLFTYMLYTNVTTLAMKKTGTSHGNHDLGGGGHGRACGRAATWWAAASISPGVLLFPIEEECVIRLLRSPAQPLLLCTGCYGGREEGRRHKNRICILAEVGG